MLVSSVLLGRLDTIALAAVSVRWDLDQCDGRALFRGEPRMERVKMAHFLMFWELDIVGNWAFLQNLFVWPKSVERC